MEKLEQKEGYDFAKELNSMKNQISEMKEALEKETIVNGKNEAEIKLLTGLN